MLHLRRRVELRSPKRASRKSRGDRLSATAHGRHPSETGSDAQPSALLSSSTFAGSLTSILSLFKPTRFPLDVEAALAETIRTVCEATGAQAGVLVLFDVDSIELSPLSVPPNPQLQQLLTDLAPEDNISCMSASFHVKGLPCTRTPERSGSSAVDLVRAIMRDGSSLSLRLTTEDAALGRLWLAGDSAWATSPRASSANELARFVSMVIDNACLFAKTSRQQRQARALYETCREIISRLDLDYILAAIVDRAQQLLGADAAHLILQDRDSGELFISLTRGIETSEYMHSRHKVTDGLIGKVVVEQQTIVSNDYLHDSSFVHLQQIDEIVSKEGNRAVICAPLFLQDRFFGAIDVWSRCAGYFTDEHAGLLTELANTAAVALENARLYEEEREAVFRLRELNAAIDSQRARQDQSLTIYDQLTRLAIDGKGADMIARALSRIVGNPVVVEDNLFNLSFYAPSVRQDGLEPGLVPDSMHQKPLRILINQPELAGQMALLTQQRRPIRMPPLPQLDLHVPRIVAPLVLDDDIVGYVSVPEVRRDLEELDSIAIEHAATVLALEMAKRKAIADVERRVREDLVQDLLWARSGADLEAMQQRAAHLGLDFSKPHRVLVLRTGNSSKLRRGMRDAEKGIARIKTQILEVVKKDVLKAFPHSVVADRGEGVAVILNLGDDIRNAGTVRAVELGNRIREDVQRQVGDIAVSIGIGNPCVQLGEFSRSFEEATRSLDILHQLGDGDRVICFDDLGAFRVIFRGDDRNELVRFAHDMLGKLIEHDQSFGSPLLDTLEVYLSNSCHIKNTAQKMYVHLNTLRYRLEKIEEITGLELSDGETRLNLQLALKITRAFWEQLGRPAARG